MREVYMHGDSAKVGLCQSVLESAGIACFIRNFHDAYSSYTGIFGPTLCVTNDADYDRARQLLEEATVAPPGAAGLAETLWRCPRCGEEVPGTFEVCWQCGAARGETPPERLA